MRDYMVRFWRRMLALGKTQEDVDQLLSVGLITQAERDAILAVEV